MAVVDFAALSGGLETWSTRVAGEEAEPIWSLSILMLMLQYSCSDTNPMGRSPYAMVYRMFLSRFRLAWEDGRGNNGKSKLLLVYYGHQIPYDQDLIANFPFYRNN